MCQFFLPDSTRKRSDNLVKQCPEHIRISSSSWITVFAIFECGPTRTTLGIQNLVLPLGAVAFLVKVLKSSYREELKWLVYKNC